MSDAAAPLPLKLGLTVAAAQLTLALSWTVYVVFLPTLAQQAGLQPSTVMLLLMLDQLVFVLADYACGVASDRVLALHARLGPWLVGSTLVSGAAFVSLPVLAPQGSPALFIAVTLLWTVTSSALRAPPMNLIGRHATRPAQPAMVALAMLGLGLAAALAPWLALVLKGQDARLPFVVASLGVCAAALAMAAAEQSARRKRTPAAAAASRPAAGARDTRWPQLLAAALLAALAFQLHTSVSAAAQFRRFVPAEALVWWLPVFWASFNLALWPAMKLAPRLGELRWVAAAALVAAAVVGGTVAPSLALLAAAQAVAGMAWAAMLAGGFMAALAMGHVGREGRFSGALSSSLAGASLARLALVASGGAAALRAGGATWPDALTALLWAASAGLLVWALKPRPAAERAPQSAQAR
ncbi:MFS transporter [Schlegelella sp. S2-27]|uniref:MFS transporter n=1 Tax=Caldimonas mangrovi TaxID=2944811 RepID=A0ABT0YUG0_9BURK|nr:MFS transporter [Caldimonas mangrovi]MCM5682389.1 MFS transporter [Caldimonas mangrovi]